LQSLADLGLKGEACCRVWDGTEAAEPVAGNMADQNEADLSGFDQSRAIQAGF
jgi:hypothetical protein